MNYDLYFHNDFDGVVSAAILRYFLKSRGDQIQNYFLMAYGDKLERKWSRLKLAGKNKNPAIVVDFRYHPEAAFWFDHHPTTFIKPEWQKEFLSTKEKKYHYWNKNYTSCGHLIIDSLKKDFGLKTPKFLKDLIKWIDIIDSANYKSAKQAIELKEPALKLAIFIDVNENRQKLLSILIKALSEMHFKKTIAIPIIKKGIKLIFKKHRRTLEFFKKNIKLFNNNRIAFIDLSTANVLNLKQTPFYFYPKLIYAIFLKKKPSRFHLTVAVNPWRRKENNLNIGELLKKFSRGAGGHKDVGGMQIKNKKKALKIIEELIVKFLANNNEK